MRSAHRLKVATAHFSTVNQAKNREDDAIPAGPATKLPLLPNNFRDDVNPVGAK